MNQKRYDECENCVYWRALYKTGEVSTKCCHYCLDTGKKRKRIGDMCLSKKEDKRGRRPNAFDIPVAQQRY